MSERIERIHQAKQGNHHAFIILMGEQKEKLRRIAGYYIKNAADIEDIVQDTVVSAYCSLHKLRSAEAFDGWLSRIAVNRALTCLQRQKRVVLTDEPKTMEAADSKADYETSMDLEDAISKLNPHLQQLIYLKYVRDLTQQQIASLLDLPLGTVKTSLRKGLKQLREQLQGKEENTQSAKTSREMEQDLVALRNRLKLQAERMFHIPRDYELLIEDYSKGDTTPHGRGEASFAWVVPGREIGIALTLSDQGSLLNYTIDLEPAKGAKALSEEQLKMNAERFVEDHYPGRLAAFPSMETAWQAGACSFRYKQTAMGLPLPFTGFIINVHSASGEIMDFTYYGEAEAPPVPGNLRDPAEVIAEIRDNLDMELMFSVLSPEIYQGGDDGIKLVYEPSGLAHLLAFPAAVESINDTNEGVAGSSGDEAELAASVTGSSESLPATEEVYLPIDLYQFEGKEWPKWEGRSLEEWAGVDPAVFELAREVEIGDTVTGVVWQKKNRALKTDRSWNAYLANRIEDTIKAKLDKESGRLLEFVQFTADEEIILQELSHKLDRKECLQIALEYVQALTPGMLPFLRMLADEDIDEKPEDGGERAHFMFRAYVGELPVGFEFTSVTVNRQSGKVIRFMASSLKPEKLAGLSSKPQLNASEAKELFMSLMKLQLKWEANYSGEKAGRHYKLVYGLVESETGRPPRLLDAMTGDVYCSARN
ncbi:hypothetical protein A7K91_09415 [Paenibacillus oryzae]|uniref:RNA polymerase subunit sigma-70 n=1 Tax=Paenibacillus oryzae TaxID=1844972 RepID=A0A1A5YBE9_9BACL|nr:sigma-70 family RNA polymerase sigma factor [Paenibacillus oryzae]OBR62929.1 hypothetical protein A7K91_09415 [Paenibacillus oryzae]